jgi:hypothetical protein
MLEFLKTHPNVDKVYVRKNGDYFLKPREGAELVTRAEALKVKSKAKDPQLSLVEETPIVAE